LGLALFLFDSKKFTAVAEMFLNKFGVCNSSFKTLPALHGIASYNKARGEPQE
jgi:hypothetical protein